MTDEEAQPTPRGGVPLPGKLRPARPRGLPIAGSSVPVPVQAKRSGQPEQPVQVDLASLSFDDRLRQESRQQRAEKAARSAGKAGAARSAAEGFMNGSRPNAFMSRLEADAAVRSEPEVSPQAARVYERFPELDPANRRALEADRQQQQQAGQEAGQEAVMPGRGRF